MMYKLTKNAELQLVKCSDFLKFTLSPKVPILLSSFLWVCSLAYNSMLFFRVNNSADKSIYRPRYLPVRGNYI